MLGGLPLYAQTPSGVTTQPVPAAPPPGDGKDLLRFTRNVRGESAPIQLAADEVFNWQEGGKHGLLLRGNVLVRLSVVHASCQQCVAWVDQEGFKAKGLWHVALYGEGSVRLDTSTQVQDGQRLALHLYTRGEMKVRSGKSRIVPQNFSRDPFVLRGQQVLKSPETPSNVEEPRVRDPRHFEPPNVKPTAYSDQDLPNPPTAPPLTSPSTPPPAPPTGPSSKQPAPRPTTPWTPSPAPPGSTAGMQITPYAPPPRKTTPVSDSQPDTGKPTTAFQPVLPSLPPVGPGQSTGPSTAAPVAPGAPPPLPPPSQPATRPLGSPGAGATAPLPPSTQVPARQYSVSPRSSTGFDIKTETLPGGEQAIIVTGGVILNVRNAPQLGLLDIEADRLVIFTRGQNPQQLINNLQGPTGESRNDLEIYLGGNVVIRHLFGTEVRTMRADEIYYDVRRNVAVALSAQLEMKPPELADPVVVKADEIIQTSAKTYEVARAEVFASKLPSDPGLKVYLAQATIEERTVPQLSVFGRDIVDRVTGQPLTRTQTWVRGSDVYFEAEDVPFFYLPRVVGDARDPLGPLEDVRVGINNVYGFRAGVGLNMFDLIGVQRFEGTRWLLDVDYLTRRGPSLGTRFDYHSVDLFGIPSEYQGVVKAHGIYDDGTDRLGGPRVDPFEPAGFRGRALWRQRVDELPMGFSVLSQVSFLSDRNYLEQYFKQEFDTGLPQTTYLYVNQQQGSWAWSGLTSVRTRDWVTETQWLPRADGYVLGYAPWDVFTYHTHAAAGYAQLRTSDDPLAPVSPTDVETSTGVVHWMQELGLPFSLGAVRVVPYGQLALTGYSNDLTGDSRGRAWGGGGVRASLPLSRIYPDIQSELFNVNGIHHKIVLRGNYFNGVSSDPLTRFPQLDRLNDDITDQALRETRPLYATALPGQAAVLTSPLFDPQRYAIRRLVTNRIDTLDDIHVLQMGINQRWQTKRGYPGSQHIVDWMTLDLSGSYFPAENRDNFGESLAFLQYDWAWNIGDRTTVVSSGWVDPVDNGPRVFDVGAFLNRPDRTNFYVGYRHIDPLQSRAISGSVSYVMSPKYALTAGAVYDFGLSTALSNTLVLTRMGKDLQISLGVSYEALQNNFGALIEIVPNLVPENQRRGIGLVGR